MEKVIQNNNKIAYIVLSGNYHRKVYYTAKSTNNVLITTTQTQYFGTYIADDDMSAGVLEGMSGTYSSTSPYEDGGYDGGSEWYTVGNDNNPLLNTMYEQNGYEWEVMLPNGQYYITAHTTQSQTTTTTSYTQSTCKTNQLYVLKSYSKTGIKVDITALTATNTSGKSTYSGTVGIYSVTSSSFRDYSYSNKTLLNSYTITSSSSNNLFYDSLISSSSRTSKLDILSRSYYTYSRTDFNVTELSSSSIYATLRTTTLSEFNGQSSTSYTTNRYGKVLPYYSISNTYPNYSFTTTGNKWNVTIGGYANYTTTSVPNYGTTPRSIKSLHVTNQSGDCYTFTLGTSYTSMLSETTTFTSYVSSITY